MGLFLTTAYKTHMGSIVGEHEIISITIAHHDRRIHHPDEPRESRSLLSRGPGRAVHAAQDAGVDENCPSGG